MNIKFYRIKKSDVSRFGIIPRIIWLSLLGFLFVSAKAIASQEVDVDISACRNMYAVLSAMRDGAGKDKIDSMLDSLLDTRPYQILFKHYNRSWRPNHLPKAVFKKMILSLQFDGEYSLGENERADAMRLIWTRYYPDLTPYENQLQQLENADLRKLINDGVQYAQGWLPDGWAIPDFYFVIVPNGGSPAFSLEGVQGYDFLQISQERPGSVDLNWLVGTVAHESHHLGMRSTMPDNLTSADSMAFQVVSLTIAEGTATAFISGPPAGRTPALAEVPFHVFKGKMVEAWDEHVANEEEILNRQAELLDKAVAGQLTREEFDIDMRDYWLNGVLGRAYVLGVEMFRAIYIAFGKEGVFSAMQNPRRLFDLYNAALDTKPDEFQHCIRVPDKAVIQALAIGNHDVSEADTSKTSPK